MLSFELIKGVDNQIFAQNGKNLFGGRPADSYMLSVSCMEYFIARKVRPVFEVYRQVFHKAVREVQKPLSTLDLLEFTIKDYGTLVIKTCLMASAACNLKKLLIANN